MKRALSIVCGIVAALSTTSVQADCADRIQSVKNHPSIVAVEPSKGGADVAIKQEGGVTKYKPEGPSLPRENWFGSKPELSAVLTHLASAEDALKTGKSGECNEEIEAAETILSQPQNWP